MKKEMLEVTAGLIGGFCVSMLGGFDLMLRTLIVFMIIDFATGLMVAFLGKSKKSNHGGLSSDTGFKGLAKKITVLFLVVVAAHMDLVLKVNYIRNAVVIGFIVNEGLSIIENSTLLGLPVPNMLKRALEVLKGESGEK